jgi:hypothetical protein
VVARVVGGAGFDVAVVEVDDGAGLVGGTGFVDAVVFDEPPPPPHAPSNASAATSATADAAEVVGRRRTGAA